MSCQKVFRLSSLEAYMLLSIEIRMILPLQVLSSFTFTWLSICPHLKEVAESCLQSKVQTHQRRS